VVQEQIKETPFSFYLILFGGSDRSLLLYYSGMKKLKIIFLFLLFFLVVLAAGYFFRNSASYQNPETAGEVENRALVEKVGMIVLLPEGEIPTVATVSDLNALKGQAFFVDAKVGYKVLIYNKAKKAFLYDPLQNKVINIAPVNLNAAKI
jgi:hypothetical protein